MILLLDAHTVLWWLSNDPELSKDAHAAIADGQNDALVSAATVWEIEIKRSLGKLDAPDDLLDRVERADFGLISISAADATRAARLPRHHRDPFDRLLVAQAIALDAILVTRDDAFTAYGARVIRA